ncbi:MAG: prepilin-type N-terminal cleavage/methylation domain-containing protein [Elusimicrobiaceae bacterium]|nr:prepilin-type N-terminal cleavage/methylation domain-containing protein [Elusimicrobiaceae bacterium]
MKKIESGFTNCQGFTLSELLAVAVILAILAVMATGSFRLATEKATFTEGLQAAEKVAAAMERFYYENPSLPYEKRIFPTMDQLDLSFSNMKDCAVTEQLNSASQMQGIDACLNTPGMERYLGAADELKAAARELSNRCKRIGKFDVYISRGEMFGQNCITTVTALRGGDLKLQCHERSRVQNSHGGYTYKDDGYFEISSSLRKNNEKVAYRDYEVNVYPSFFDGSTGLFRCLGNTLVPILDRLFQKKVACVGLERMCATMGFTENLDASRVDTHGYSEKSVYRWVRP